MSFRPSGRVRPRRGVPPPPRSLLRRLLDYALTAAILLAAGRSSRRGSTASRHGRISGDAIVNDGDSITLDGRAHPPARHRCAGVQPDLPQGRRRPIPAAAARARRWSRLTGGGRIACAGWERDRYGRLLGVCTAGGVDLNRRQVEAGLGGRLWRLRRRRAVGARSAAPACGPGTFERPRDWRAEHGGMAESEHDLFARLVNWLRAIFGFS